MKSFRKNILYLMQSDKSRSNYRGEEIGTSSVHTYPSTEKLSDHQHTWESHMLQLGREFVPQKPTMKLYFSDHLKFSHLHA